MDISALLGLDSSVQQGLNAHQDHQQHVVMERTVLLELHILVNVVLAFTHSLLVAQTFVQMLSLGLTHLAMDLSLSAR